MLKNVYKLIISIVVCQIAGFIGSIFTSKSIQTWYAGLAKPALNPPDWIFAPIWTTLFLLMGISLYLVWVQQSKTAIIIFFIQLILNVVWSILFFGLKNPLLAFIEIIILWISILITIIYFYHVSKTSSYLLIPYILWVSFAAYLNFMLYFLNR